jgi:uncharacterized protein YcnI
VITAAVIGLLYLGPALLLGAVLLGGRYPGERVLSRPLRRRFVVRRRPLRRALPRPPRRTAPRGGLLIAAGLAGRGPPTTTARLTRSSHFDTGVPLSMKRLLLAGALAAGSLGAFAAAASAHVTMQPKAQTAGAYTVVNVRVPNERDTASTTKVRIAFPDGIYSVSYAAQAGWKVAVKKSRLATPVQTEDGPITERVSSVTFTGSGRGLGRIAPGQFKEFPLSLQMPDQPGATLAFPAYQTYSNGEVVRWTGAAGTDTPAPTVALAAPAAALRSPLARAAHAPVKSRTPAPGSKASKVNAVKVTFGESVVTGLISVSKGGQEVTAKSAGLKPSNHAILQATFAKALSKGTYKVSWRARADDGHSESGTWSFTVR